jgi:uncharacterized linocin/CFP29 family protein
MQELLARDQAPLSRDEWAQLDAAAVATARRLLVGRRFLDLFGPLGAGLQEVPYQLFPPQEPAVVTVSVSDEPMPAPPGTRVLAPVPLLYRDFLLPWRDLEEARRLHLPLSTDPAAAAAAQVALREDDLIVNGEGEAGTPGLLTVPAALHTDAGEWATPGAAFRATTAAIQRLLSAGFPPPYALLVNPVAFAHLQRVYAGSGVLEVAHVRALVQGGVYQTSAIRTAPGLVLALGAHNVDLALGQDLTIAYLGPHGMSQLFRVFETLTVRIKRPQAICVLEGAAPDPQQLGP